MPAETFEILKENRGRPWVAKAWPDQSGNVFRFI